MKNNLFSFATSELSQDAFICWLLNFAHQDRKGEDQVLEDCAKDLLRIMVPHEPDPIVTDIHRQFRNIDVLVELNNKYNVIIEDKTYTGQHGNQIDNYVEVLKEHKRENIVTVYFKIIEQDHPEETDVNITRKTLLDVFSKYIDVCDNAIFCDYYHHLLRIDEEVIAYKTSPIKDWMKGNQAYIGFFDYLIESKIINKQRGFGWGYVPNKSAGFWGLWWHFHRDLEYKRSDGTTLPINEVYLQIENDKITVKMTSNQKVELDDRWALFNTFKGLVPEFSKKRFAPGKSMTIGYINYDESSYSSKISEMQKTLETFVESYL